MSAESLARLDEVFVDHQQITKTCVPGVKVSVERKRVIAVEPARPGLTSLSGAPYRNHISLL
jgi:hypothetical protein